MKHYFQEKVPLDKISKSALACFMKNGFHGTSIREIAAAAELSVPGVYHHYVSKVAILENISSIAMESLLTELKSVSESATGAVELFNETVSCMLQFHAIYGDVAFVSFSEIRSLPEASRELHLRDRRHVQELISAAVEKGVAAGVFATKNSIHAARAVTNICMGVSQWYVPDGELSIEKLVDIYSAICRDTVHYVLKK